MKLLSTLASVGAVFGMAACATAPATHDFSKSRTFAESNDVIWDRAVAYFTSHDLSITTIDKASGVIVAVRKYADPQSDAGLAGDADCGKDPLALRLHAKADLNIVVRPLPDGQTNVNVNTRVEQTFRYGDSPPSVSNCNSTGKLEAAIFEALAKPAA
jgi:hypothetical protein